MKKSIIPVITLLVILSFTSVCYGENICDYAYKDNYKMVKTILGANPSMANFKDKEGYSPLMAAIIGNSPKTAQLLLEKGADPNYRNRQAHGWSALIFAIRYPRPVIGLKLVKLLVSNGANVNLPTYNHKTRPIHHACWGGDRWLAIFKYLIEHGARVNDKTDVGKTPLYFLEYEMSGKAKKKMTEYVKSIGGKNYKKP